MKTIVIGCDNAAVELKNTIMGLVEQLGYAVENVGCDSSDDPTNYPTIAKRVCERIIESGYEKNGILVCGTGIGISIAANRYHGIRAALLYDDFVAEMAKKHNNANVIVFGGRTMKTQDVIRRIDIFNQNEFEGGRHIRRIEKIEEGK